MKDMERPTFEDQLKNSFEGAESSPSPKVWDGIEVDLMRAESVQMRDRLVFYKWVAAASVIIALTAGAFTFYQLSNPEQILVAGKQTPEVANQKAPQVADSGNVQKLNGTRPGDIQSGDVPANNGEDQRSARRVQENKSSHLQTSGDHLAAAHSEELKTASASKVIANQKTEETSPDVLTRNNFVKPGLASLPEVRVVLASKQTSSADPVQLMLARLADDEKKISERENSENSRSDEKIWTSVGFAAGAFNSSNASVSTTSNAAVRTFNDDVADKEASASGVAYSVGMNVGTRISRNWVLQGGINYLTQTSQYTAQTAVGTPDFSAFSPPSISGPKDYDGDGVGDEKVISTSPYNINNSVRYLSVPLQAGYMIVDKLFGVQVNAGVSTDLFLRNVKTAEGENIQDVDQGRGSAPYRPVNFSGLMGAEVSYKFGNRYRIALNPGIRYPFSSVYKNDSGVKSNPLTLDLGLRFRYIFQ